MAAYSRRGFRIKLILEEYSDHRKKCFFFVNVMREKHVRNVMQRIWHFYYKDHCSTPDNLLLLIDDFFIPPCESTFVLKENDVISVRVHPPAAGATPAPASRPVRSTVAPLTATPGTLVESVAVVLQRLQDGTGPHDSERSERERLNKVAEILAAETDSDVSTDEDGVTGPAGQLTSRHEVVRLSQKISDQATPPPPCAARRHDLSDQLTLTAVSRELRRRYEAARQPPPAAVTSTSTSTATPISTSASTSTSTCNTNFTSTHTPVSAPLSTCAVSAPAPVAPLIAPGPTPAVCNAGAAAAGAEHAASPALSMSSLDSSTSFMAKVQEMEESARAMETDSPGRCGEDKGKTSGQRRLVSEAPVETRRMAGGATSTPFARPLATGLTRGAQAVGAVKMSTDVCSSGAEAIQREEGGQDGGNAVGKRAGDASLGQGRAGAVKAMSGSVVAKAVSTEAVRPDEVLSVSKAATMHSHDTNIPTGDKGMDRGRPQKPAAQTMPEAKEGKASTVKKVENKSEVKQRDTANPGSKRARSPSTESSSESSSSEEDSSETPTPAKKPSAALNDTTAASNEASTEKKRKTRTRRRRGKKRRTPEAPPTSAPPPPPPRADDYARRHGLPRGEIDRYKRSSSVAIGWQTRPKNRRVVFDDEGNPLLPGGERGAAGEGTGRWEWSQGRGERFGADTGPGRWSGSRDGVTSADSRSGWSKNADGAGNSLSTGHHSRDTAAIAENSIAQTSAATASETAPASSSHSRTQSNATAASISAPNTSVPSSLPITATTAPLPQPLPSEHSQRTPAPSATNSSWSGNSAPGTGGRRSSSLGAGLLPRAFMRPRRCVDPPRRSEVMGGLRDERTPRSGSETARDRTNGALPAGGGSGRLLRPRYLLEGGAGGAAASCAADGGRAVGPARAGTEDVSGVSEARRQSGSLDTPRPRAGESDVDRTPHGASAAPSATVAASTSLTTRLSTSAPSASASATTPRSGAAPASPPPLTPSPRPPPAAAPPPATVVLDARGRPAETSAARDLRHLAASGERRPLVVVRRQRSLPGRAAYREVTKQEGPGEAGAGAGGYADNGTTAAIDAANSGEASKALSEGNSRSIAGDGDDGLDSPASSSRDVYSNVSVILPGPPLEALSPGASCSDGASRTSEDPDAESVASSGSGGEVQCVYGRTPADASVDSISNCNVVNAVGQNRRLEKQRARGLPPGGGKENQAPTNAVKDDKFYSQFPLMKDAALKGDLIAFKCWDMAADYSPYVSEYREATVLDAAGERQNRRLTLQLIEYRPRGRRRGRFEITSPDDDEVVDLEEESGLEERSWSELIQPRLLHP